MTPLDTHCGAPLSYYASFLRAGRDVGNTAQCGACRRWLAFCLVGAEFITAEGATKAEAIAACGGR